MRSALTVPTEAFVGGNGDGDDTRGSNVARSGETESFELRSSEMTIESAHPRLDGEFIDVFIAVTNRLFRAGIAISSAENALGAQGSRLLDNARQRLHDARDELDIAAQEMRAISLDFQLENQEWAQRAAGDSKGQLAEGVEGASGYVMK